MGGIAFQLGLMGAGSDRLRSRRCQQAAAARAAEGALGLDRPRASGSRCRRKPARQDFSRRAAARRCIGSTAAPREVRATDARRTKAAARATLATTDAARAVSAVGPPARQAATWRRSQTMPPSMLLAYAFQAGDRCQQAVHI